jgi:hypothetical protein
VSQARQPDHRRRRHPQHHRNSTGHPVRGAGCAPVRRTPPNGSGCRDRRRSGLRRS